MIVTADSEPQQDLGVRSVGVRCPKCNCAHCPVVKVVHYGQRTKRSRRCRHCDKTFATWEQVIPDSQATP